jgi:hypothetical protein
MKFSTHSMTASSMLMRPVQSFFSYSPLTDPITQGRVQTQGLDPNDELGGYYVVEC